MRSQIAAAAAAALLLLPGGGTAQAHGAHGAHGAHAGHSELQCAAPRGDVAARASPYDSVQAHLGDGMVKVCYGRPSVLGRTLVGGEPHPYGEPWRLGANEATAIHLSFPAEIGGVRVEPGSYSLYAIPGASEWQIVVNAAAERWGIPISPEVRAQDVGSVTVAAETLASPVELLTIHLQDAGSDTLHMVVEWEGWRIRVPIRRV